MKKSLFNDKVKALAMVSLSSFLGLLFFQNCSNKASFKSSETSGSQSVSIGDVRTDSPPIQTPVHTSNFQCREYIEITADQFSIPARDERGLCYYKKLFTGVGMNKSSNYYEAADGVDFQKPLVIQEEIGLIVNLQGERKTVISGAVNEEKSFLIDNFMLLEITGSKSEFVGWSYFYDKTMLVYNKAQQTVPKKIYITQFTHDDALVSPWDLSSKISLNQNLNIQLSTLDNGGAYQVSNTYIVFK